MKKEAKNSLKEERMKEKENVKKKLTKLTIENKVLKISLTLLIFVLVGFTIFIYINYTGYVTVSDFHNMKTVEANVNQENIAEHVVFTQFFPDKCKDGIAVNNGSDDIEFETFNEVYDNGLCKETDVRFKNQIYGLSEEVEVPVNSITGNAVKLTGNVVEGDGSGTTGSVVEENPSNEPPAEEPPAEEPPAQPTEVPETSEPPAETPAETPQENLSQQQAETGNESQASQGQQQEQQGSGGASGSETRMIKVPRIIKYTIYFDKTIEKIKKENTEQINVTKTKKETTEQGRAVIGKPVKWTKKIQLGKETNNLSVVIANDASNIEVKKIENGVETSIGDEKLKIREDGEEKSLEIESQQSNSEQATGVTGSAITGFAVDVPELVVQENVQEIQIEYETPAPYAVEKETASGKEITIASDAEVHYTNVLAYTELENEATSDRVKLYHIVNGEKEIVEINKSDTNNNGLIDYIEWNVESLSNQSYELRIEVFNVYSHPTLFSNWVVEFKTYGQGDLKITATSNENYTTRATRWSNQEESGYDLKLLEIKCGQETRTYEWQGDDCLNNECSVFIANYSCEETSYETSKELIADKHVLRFEFDNETAWAFNSVPVCEGSVTGNCNDITDSTQCANAGCVWDGDSCTIQFPGGAGCSAMSLSDCKCMGCTWNEGTSECEGTPSSRYCEYCDSDSYCGSVGYTGSVCAWDGSASSCEGVIPNACGTLTDETQCELTGCTWTEGTPESDVMSLTGTASVNYGTASDWTASETNTLDNDCTYGLWMSTDNATWGSALSTTTGDTGTPLADTRVYSAGQIYYRFGIETECANYVPGFIYGEFSVNKADASVNMSKSAGSESLNYGTASDWSFAETNTGDEGCTYYLYNSTDNSTWIEVANAAGSVGSISDTNVYAVGTIYYNYSLTGCQNYSDSSVYGQFDVLPLQTSLTFNYISPITYGIQLNVSCSNITGSGTLTLYRDGVDVTSENNQYVTLGVNEAGYLYECNLTGTASTTNSSLFIINKASPSKSDTGIFVRLDMDSIDGSGNPQDVSGNNNHGTKVGDAVQTSGGVFGTNAFSFDGNGDTISLTDLFSSSSGITISAWVNPTDIHVNPYYEIYRDTNTIKLFSFQDWGTVLSFGLDLSGFSELDVPINYADYENQWVLVTATYDGSMKRVYRNGVEIGSAAASGNFGVGGTGYIGSSGGGAEFFNGLIDDVRIYNRALNPNEIVELYNSGAIIETMNITGTTPITYGTMSDFSGSETNTGDDGCVYSLDRENAVYGVGTWTFNYSTSGCANYLAGSVTKDLVVTQNSTANMAKSAGSESLNYGTASDWSFAETNTGDDDCVYTLYYNYDNSSTWNSITASTPYSDTIVHQAGQVYYNFSVAECQNYSSSSVYGEFSVNKADATTLMAKSAGSESLNYGTASDWEFAETNTGDDDCTYTLYYSYDNSTWASITAASPWQDTAIHQGGQVYYNFSVAECSNYSSSSVYGGFSVNKATPTLTLLANSGSENLTLTYPQQVNVSASSDYGTVSLDRDEVDVLSENGLNVTLGVGSYIYRANITGNENYSDVGYSYYNVTINKASSNSNLAGSAILGYGIASDWLANETNTGDDDCNYTFYNSSDNETWGLMSSTMGNTEENLADTNIYIEGSIIYYKFGIETECANYSSGYAYGMLTIKRNPVIASCSGTPSNDCTQFLTEGECTNFNSFNSECSWSPDCSGTPESCTSFSSQELCENNTAHGGCSWSEVFVSEENCSGTPSNTACSDYGTEVLCLGSEAHGGCAWSDNEGACSGTVTIDCSQWNGIENLNTCNSHAACTFQVSGGENCNYKWGGQGGCSAGTNYADCTDAGCDWTGCSGTATCSGITSSSSCTNEGCSWNGCSGTSSCTGFGDYSSCSGESGCSFSGCTGALTCASQNLSYSMCAAVSGCSSNRGMSLAGSLARNYGQASDWETVEYNVEDEGCNYSFYYSYDNSTWSNISSPDNRVHRTGLVYYKYNVTGCSNYSSGNLEGVMVINKASSQTSMTFNTSQTISYGTLTTPNCSRVSGEGSVVLYKDNVNINEQNNQALNLSVGGYTFECRYAETQNYSAASQTKYLNVTRVVSGLDSSLGITLLSDGTNVKTTGQQGVKRVIIKEGSTKIVDFDLNFSNLDSNYSDILAGSNLTSGKSFFHASGHDEIIGNRTLYIPAVTGSGILMICPNATSFDDINSSCPNEYELSSVSNASGYYRVNVTGTGGAEINTPVISSVIVNSTSANNYASGNLQCYVQATDADTSSLTAYYKWYLNGELQEDPVSGSTSVNSGSLSLINTVGCLYLEKFANWTCSVRVGDGIGYSSWQNSTITIANIPPGVTSGVVCIPGYDPGNGGGSNNITIRTSTGSTTISSGMSLIGTASIWDAESDSLTYEYRWAKDNVIQSGLTSLNVSSSSLSAGTWRLETRANDGYNWGSWILSNSVVLTTTSGYCGDGTCNGVEKCSTCSRDCGACTSSGSSTTTESNIISTEDLSSLGVEISADSFNVDETVRIIDTRDFTIRNTGISDIIVKISLVNLEGIIRLNGTSFVIKPGEDKKFEFDIVPPNEPGIYTGKILLTIDAKTVEIPFALNVKSEKSLFDISVDIANEFRVINTGGRLKAQITLIQAGLQEKVDVTMNYVIKDYEGNDYLKESETIAVEKQKSYNIEFSTAGLKPGKYILGAEVVYAGGVATASSQFTINKWFGSNVLYIGLLVLVVASFISVILIIRGYNKKIAKFRKKRRK